MLDAAPTRTPLPFGVHLVKADPSYEVDAALRSKYQQLIGSLLWIALGTCPDIAYAVNRLSQYSAKPTMQHYKATQYILRYLNGSRSLRLCYKGSGLSGLIGYSDSDWAENKDDRHSTSGFVFFMADAAISWVSRQQKTVGLSSTEAEYMALSDSCRQLAWLWTLQSEIGFKPQNATPLCIDNNGSIFLAVNPAHDRRTKHIDIQYHFCREFIENGHVDLFFVPTAEQRADILTKNLSFSIHEKFVHNLGLE